MARLNVARPGAHGTTHEGAPAAAMNAEQALRRSVLSCLLWEKEFYEDGEEIAARIVRLAGDVSRETLAALAIEAREEAKLRHVPLLLLSALAKRTSEDRKASKRPPEGDRLTREAIARAIQRADELAEFLAIHVKAQGAQPNKIKPLMSAQMKRGIAAAFQKFDEYQLAKYDRAGPVRLRDALFLSHAKPKDEEQAALWKRLVEGELKVPDTWEVNLSRGDDKKLTFERMLREGKLGYLALLRNLRNMVEAGCDLELVKAAIVARKGAWRVLPFRYVAAARAAPQLEPWIDLALLAAIRDLPVLPGTTAVLADVSSSMNGRLSGKSDLSRMDAACILAAIIPGDVRMFSFSDVLVEVPPRRGMAGVDALMNSQRHNGTRLIDAVATVQKSVPHDRMVVITDEQSHPSWSGSRLGDPRQGTRGYMINVASNQRGVGYGAWTHIDGFSENTLRYIREVERKPGEKAEPARAEAELETEDQD